MAVGTGTNGSTKFWTFIATGITILAIWTGAVYVFASHVGDGEIHQTAATKQEVVQKVVDQEIDHLKELLLQRLESIDQRLEKIEKE